MNQIARCLLVIGVSAAVFAAAACGGGDGGGDDVAFQVIVHPEFVQGVFGGQAVTVLATVEDGKEGAGDVSLDATFSGGTVQVEPGAIADGELAEITLTADAVDEELEAELTIVAERGSIRQTASRTVAVIPGEDDLGPMASDLLALFTAWLEDSHPDLGISPEREFDGGVVAPRLLVVSHYMFEDDEYELGLSWHVTIPPDDWSELYVRPRDELLPTRAFRLSSWTAALAGEPAEFTEVAPPPEVVR